MKNKIYELRVLSRYTQEELAKKLGVTRQTVISLEKERYIPSLEMGFKVARLFDKNIEEVFEYLNEE
ncbi:MAG: helix-turn-helix transcriptional regulator [Spirochaetales bacterium]|nr:helix-turn-helix transcriptional regulator [Spirochaetales bacterium]